MKEFLGEQTHPLSDTTLTLIRNLDLIIQARSALFVVNGGSYCCTLLLLVFLRSASSSKLTLSKSA